MVEKKKWRRNKEGGENNQMKMAEDKNMAENGYVDIFFLYQPYLTENGFRSYAHPPDVRHLHVMLF